VTDAALYCEDVQRLCGDFSCCDSCHEDVEYGFDLIEVGVFDENGSPRVALVCCAGSRAAEQGQ
jgi:hypothetical protein